MDSGRGKSNIDGGGELVMDEPRSGVGVTGGFGCGAKNLVSDRFSPWRPVERCINAYT